MVPGSKKFDSEQVKIVLDLEQQFQSDSTALS